MTDQEALRRAISLCRSAATVTAGDPCYGDYARECEAAADRLFDLQKRLARFDAWLQEARSRRTEDTPPSILYDPPTERI